MSMIGTSDETATCVECRAQVASRDCDLTARGPTCARCVAARGIAETTAAYGIGGSIADRGVGMWLWVVALTLVALVGVVLAWSASRAMGGLLTPVALLLAIRQWSATSRRRRYPATSA
jgi:hypothetical protein